MKGYLECKKELIGRCESAKYFNRKFYETFRGAVLMTIWKQKNGIEDVYTDADGIIRRHSYDDVYKSDFYNKNSCAYCAFLEIVA